MSACLCLATTALLMAFCSFTPSRTWCCLRSAFSSGFAPNSTSLIRSPRRIPDCNISLTALVTLLGVPFFLPPILLRRASEPRPWLSGTGLERVLFAVRSRTDFNFIRFILTVLRFAYLDGTGECQSLLFSDSNELCATSTISSSSHAGARVLNRPGFDVLPLQPVKSATHLIHHLHDFIIGFLLG